MRQCRTCNTYKEEHEFPVQRKTGFRGDSSKVTRRLDCKTCVAAAAREYRANYVTKPKAKLDPSVNKYLYSAIGCRVSDARARGASVQ